MKIRPFYSFGVALFLHVKYEYKLSLMEIYQGTTFNTGICATGDLSIAAF